MRAYCSPLLGPIASHATHALRGKRMGYSPWIHVATAAGFDDLSAVRPHAALLFGDVPVGDAYDVPLFLFASAALPTSTHRQKGTDPAVWQRFPGVAMATRRSSVASARANRLFILQPSECRHF